MSDITLNGFTLFSEVPAYVSQVQDPTGAGVFLAVRHDKLSPRLALSVGRPHFRGFVACHRYEPWWMKPATGTKTAEIPVETQSLLLELDQKKVALIVPLLDAPMRCSVEGYPTGELMLVAESGDPAVMAQHVVGLFVAVGDCPFELCKKGSEAVTQRIPGCRLRKDKPLPGFVDQFGWCTWDAFYQEVSHDKVRLGLESFKRGGVTPKLLILDDGWQSMELNPTNDKRLVAFAANEKFPGDLAPTVRMAKQEFGVQTFLVWHAFQGYWGGVSGEKLPGYGVRDLSHQFGQGIHHYRPAEWFHWQGRTSGALGVDRAHDFYHDFHRHLRAQGVDGVKVDNQSTSEGVAHSQGGRVNYIGRLHEALEGSTHVHFKGNLINCMSHGNDVLYQTPASTLTRSSTDFWPNTPSSHGLHLYTNAQVCTWFGQFIHGDWDMFQSGHAWGAFHAAGRAVSGSPIYVSDKPEAHDFELLRKVVFSDGTVPRCKMPGRPTRDCLFRDVTSEDVLLKIWNRTEAAAVVGLFNAQHHEKPEERTVITGSVSPSDVPGNRGERFVLHLHRAGTMRVVSLKENVEVQLGESEWEIATISPIADGFAAVGLTKMLNASGAIAATVRTPSEVRLTLRDGGRFEAWTSAKPQAAEFAGKPVTFEWEDGQFTCDLPGPGVLTVRFSEI